MYVILFALLGGLISRDCGSHKPIIPFGLSQAVYAAPYGVIAFLGLLSTVQPIGYPYPYHLWALTLLAYVGAFLGKRTGHGGGIDLGTWKEPRDDERLEFLIKPFKRFISDYAYDALLLGITGLVVSIVSGVVLGIGGHIMAGVILALSGCTKAIAYAIGWRVYPKGSGKGIRHLDEATAIGEFLTGFFAFGILGIVYYLI